MGFLLSIYPLQCLTTSIIHAHLPRLICFIPLYTHVHSPTILYPLPMLLLRYIATYPMLLLLELAILNLDSSLITSWLWYRRLFLSPAASRRAVSMTGRSTSVRVKSNNSIVLVTSPDFDSTFDVIFMSELWVYFPLVKKAF